MQYSKKIFIALNSLETRSQKHITIEGLDVVTYKLLKLSIDG